MELTRQKAMLTIAALAMGMAALAVLYFFAPAEHRFYPRCIFHAVTGLSCPGCGSLRAAHSFLHGEFAQAFRFNPLIFLLVPLAGMAWFVCRPAGLSALPAKWIWALLSIILLFAMLRNLPVAPFSYFNL